MSVFRGGPRDLDMLCLGRVGMDLYADEAGVPLSAVQHFSKSLGGSPGNIAVGMARLGARVGMLSVLSDDAVGESVLQLLHAEGVDTSAVRLDDSAQVRTTLAIAEQRNEDCRVVLYRNGAADLGLNMNDVPVALFERARALLVSGTALSCSPSREAALAAMQRARQAGATVVLDLDARPTGWASLDEAALYCRLAVQQAEVIFGNTEELAVLARGLEPLPSVETWLFEHAPAQLLFLKAGPEGSTAVTREGERVHQPPFVVEARKPYGAGDAYAAAICAALLSGSDLAVALRRGAAAAAIVVAGQHCALSSPTPAELDTFLQTRSA